MPRMGAACRYKSSLSKRYLGYQLPRLCEFPGLTDSVGSKHRTETISVAANLQSSAPERVRKSHRTPRFLGSSRRSEAQAKPAKLLADARDEGCSRPVLLRARCKPRGWLNL